jgi:hypothetical protein
MVEKGMRDVFGRSYFPFISGDFDVQVYRSPALDVETDQTVMVDWNHALPVDSLPLTINDPASTPGSWSVSSSYYTPYSQGFRRVQDNFGQVSSYGAVPAALRQPGDLTRVDVSQNRSPSGTANLVLLRAAFEDLSTPAAVTLAPPDYLSPVAPVIDLNAVSQLSVTVPIWKPKLGHTVSVARFTTQLSIVPDHYLNMFVRPGWAGDTASLTLRVPDLRNLADWTTDMELSGRAQVNWEISAMDQDQPLDAPLGQARTAIESTLMGMKIPPGLSAAMACGEHCDPPAASRRSPFARRAP